MSTPLEQYTPHREDPPPRICGRPGCEVILSSANTTTRCWPHGGWLELVTWRESKDSHLQTTLTDWNLKASKVCSHPHCPNTQPCPEHTPKPWAGSNRRSELPRNWNKLRRRALRRDPLCRACGMAPATEVDHIADRFDHRLSNLQGLCARCHREKTLREARAAHS